MTSETLVLTVEEAAQLLGVSRTVAYQAVGRGEIPHVRIGRRIVIPKAALEKMLSGGDDLGGARPNPLTRV